MRHGKAEPPKAGLRDHDRALDPRGVINAHAQAGHCAPGDDEHMLVSDALRTRQTAEVLMAAWNSAGIADLPEMHITPHGYLAPADRWIDLAAMVPDTCSTLWIIGHNPGISALITELTGGYLGMATADVVHIDLDLEHWRDMGPRCGTTTVHLPGRTA